MHWRNEKEWASWSDREIDGVLYTFSHLRSFDMFVEKEAKGSWPAFAATIRVVFDCHVLTERGDIHAGGSAFWRDTGGKIRRFSLQRYQYSWCLPDLLSSLPSGRIKCYVAKHRNYMIWKPAGSAGHAQYQVYFDLYKPATQPAGDIPRLLLYVQSAFLKNEPFAQQRHRFKAFGTICAEVAGVIPKKTRGERQKPP